jgi:hypothetical protein
VKNRRLTSRYAIDALSYEELVVDAIDGAVQDGSV